MCHFRFNNVFKFVIRELSNFEDPSQARQRVKEVCTLVQNTNTTDFQYWVEVIASASNSIVIEEVANVIDKNKWSVLKLSHIQPLCDLITFVQPRELCINLSEPLLNRVSLSNQIFEQLAAYPTIKLSLYLHYEHDNYQPCDSVLQTLLL